MRVVTRLKGIHTMKRKLADGTVRLHYYHRATRIPLPDDPCSPEFLAAFREAEASMRPKRPGTIALLIDRFKDSTDWAQLRESTRAIMKLNLRAAEAEFGTMPIAALEDRRCRSIFLAWHEKQARATPRAADAKLQALQRVLSWAHDRGLAPANPIESFRRAYSSSRAEKIWLPHHVTAMENAAGPELRLALLLALHTGQRQGDLLRLTWKAFDGEAITLVQSKTRAKVYIPCTHALLAELLAAREAAKESLHILRAPNGRPWSPDAFKKAWRTAFTESGITEDLHFHDLRGTAVTMLAEAGATTPEIASITGHSIHSVERIIEVYLARTKTLATSAITKLNEHARNRKT